MTIFLFRKGKQMGKGGGFEWEVAKKLSLWWSEGKRDDIFCRSQASGARFTVRKKVGKDTANQSGDITFSDAIGEPLIKLWSIECKTGYGKKKKIRDEDNKIVAKEDVRWDLLDFLDSSHKVTVLSSMWEQCKRDAKKSRKIPILVFRRNRRKKCVMLDDRVYQSLCGYVGPSECKTIFLNIPSVLQDGFFKIMLFDDFLFWLRFLPNALIPREKGGRERKSK